MTKNKLGLVTLTSLVTGNMVGSGIFILPADLARIGSISLLSWIFTSLGAFLLALVFSRMSVLIPKTGGPYAYADAGFGDFIGLQTAYNYWVAVWVGNCAVVVALIGYLRIFLPFMNDPFWGVLAGIGFVWIFTAINISGIHSVGVVQLVSTILKFVPLLIVAIFGWWYFHPEFIKNSFNLTTGSNFSAFSHAATLTMWAFVGVESATVPAASVENPRRNIPLATLFGTLIAALIYMASSTAIMGMLPASELINSGSPFAAAAQVIFGTFGKWLVAAGAVISCLGALNGWTLLQGQVPMAAADDKLLPVIFSKRNKVNVPAWGLVITAIAMSIFLLMTVSPNLVDQFQLIILIAATTSLIAYFYTAVALIVVSREQNKNSFIYLIVAIFASVYSVWAIFGAGKNIIFYVSMLVFSSIPLYAWMRWKRLVKHV